MTICCHGELLDLTTPRIMGILNTTPDSFFDGGRFTDARAALLRAEQLLEEGATFIDVGGYSTRPGAAEVSESDELSRVAPLVERLRTEFPKALISVDTFRSRVAREALEAGASLINDISAGTADADMLPLIAEKQVPVVLMHMRGTPSDMAEMTEYDNLVTDILRYLSGRLAAARELGIGDIIADPGFGFAKTREQNFKLLAALSRFDLLEVPILVGLSRKSLIWKTLDIAPSDALNGTTALHMLALQAGASILRVHDVREAAQCVRLWQEVRAEN